MEASPRVLELTGDDLHKVMHAYGTNGIITEVEMPLDAAYDWVDVIVGFDDYMEAVRFANSLANQDGLLFKEIATVAAPVALRLFPAPPEIPPPRALASCSLMVAPHALDAVPRPHRARQRRRDPLPLRHRDRGRAARACRRSSSSPGTTRRCGRSGSIRPSPICRCSIPSRTSSSSVERMHARLRRRGAGASRIHPLRRQGHAAPACRSCASPARSGSTRSSASTRTMAARSSTRTATRWRKAA